MMQPCSPELITETVKEAAANVLQQLTNVPAQVQADAQLSAMLESVFAVSPYVMQTAQRYSDQFHWLAVSGALSPAGVAPDKCELIRRLCSASCEPLGQFGVVSNAQAGSELDQQMVQLRKCRHQEMLRIIWQDLLGHAPLDETLLSLSTLADACIDVASQWSHASVAERFGQAQDEDGNPMQMLVLGMGKLGGQELNVSSDIDLIYIYPRAGKSNSEKSIDNEAYFRRVAQQLSQLLGNVTVDGFVFRVDTRLRPFGDSGPLVMNLNALEQYYITQGRDWERYAMIKARPIVGDEESVASLMELLTPFVYRRYLDYSAIDALRELKRKIALSVKQKSLHNNIKLGLGGIREIEFIGQAFQLVRGGRQQRLRVRPIKKVLRQLNDMALISADDVQQLTCAYDFLRRTENSLQAMRDHQTHSLPTDPADKTRLYCMLNFSSYEQFESELNKHRHVVSSHFNALFSDWDEGDDERDDDLDNPANIAWAVLSSPEVQRGAAEDAVRSLGLEPGDELMESIITLSSGGFYQRLTARSQARIDRIMPSIIDATMQQTNTADALLRCLNFVRAVAGRSGYLQILIERPPALHRLVNLFAKSAWVSNFVTRHPIVIDELLRDNAQAELPDRAQLLSDAMIEAKRLSELELDQQMDAMRQFQQARTLRVAAAELNDDLPLMRVSDQLTWLAESIIAAVVHLVEHSLHERFGKPTAVIDGTTVHPELGVVAYGKLGGIELGYGSDLDLVFLHESTGQRQNTDGKKSIENGLYYARLAQKVVHFMTTHTPAGVLYDIDLRLRPNGQSGVLVTGMDSFEQYQQTQAWTWEHQALVRTRMILGSEQLTGRFERIRRQVLAQKREPLELVTDVTQMRERMRDNLQAGGADQMHLKNDAGGVADVEFMVQYLVLAHAATAPELLLYSDNVRILEVAARVGLIQVRECEQLTQHYLSLRRFMHRQSLQLKSPLVQQTDLTKTIAKEVTESWNQLLITPFK